MCIDSNGVASKDKVAVSYLSVSQDVYDFLPSTTYVAKRVKYLLPIQHRQYAVSEYQQDP